MQLNDSAPSAHDMQHPTRRRDTVHGTLRKEMKIFQFKAVIHNNKAVDNLCTQQCT